MLRYVTWYLFLVRCYFITFNLSLYWEIKLVICILYPVESLVTHKTQISILSQIQVENNKTTHHSSATPYNMQIANQSRTHDEREAGNITPVGKQWSKRSVTRLATSPRIRAEIRINSIRIAPLASKPKEKQFQKAKYIFLLNPREKQRDLPVLQHFIAALWT